MTAIFDPHINIEDILLVGCGGTGAQVARHLCRMLWDRRQRNLTVPNLTFIDPDQVTMKNVGRQLFTPADVGQPKAEVLMRRFNTALGLQTRAIVKQVSQYELSRYEIVIGCVDSYHGRRSIAHYYHGFGVSENNKVWIDAGNHHDTGQVVIGNALAENLRWTTTPQGEIHYNRLPIPSSVFPSLLEEEKAVTLSCAEAQAAGEQNLFINDWMALAVTGYVYKLLYRQPITSFMTWIGIGSCRAVPITGAELRAKMPNLPQLHDEQEPIAAPPAKKPRRKKAA